MKIIQPSPQELICESNKNMQELFTSVATGGISLCGYWLLSVLVSKQWQNPTVSIGFLMLSAYFLGSNNYIVTFNLDTKIFQVKRYWIIFKKSQHKNHQLSDIKIISVVKKHRSSTYNIILRHKNGEDILIACTDSTDIILVDDKAQKIRDFLGLDPMNQISYIR